MSDKLHLTPEDDFPEDLAEVGETEFRHYDLDEEVEERDKRE